ncbi:hypothetical protein A2U01_0085698, partial [Trifolium medium]|nr:hypothetical protein [Trifolium medium]
VCFQASEIWMDDVLCSMESSSTGIS